MSSTSISLREALGLTNLPRALAQARLAVRGDGVTPPSRFDLSSLGILQPRLSLATWLGRRRADRRVPLYNLFNHTRPPVPSAWSVRVTRVEDFMGRGATYDSHNGTDFAVPVGTVVTAACAGVVLRVSDEFDRGGLEVLIDHGDGLVTTSNHLARAMVAPGDRVARGQPIALSGMSGIDGVVTFPWGAPHVHYNTWLNGEPVDPFARVSAGTEEVSLWVKHNDPVPAPEHGETKFDTSGHDSQWDHDAVDRVIAGCVHDPTRAVFSSRPRDALRAADALFYLNYYPSRFSVRESVYATQSARAPRLDLPFLPRDFVGVAMPEGRGW